MQDGLILTRVQIPPPAFRLMIVEQARLAALRILPLYRGFMDQMNVNFPIGQLRIPRICAYSSLSCACPLCPTHSKAGWAFLSFGERLYSREVSRWVLLPRSS
jgi:hypothetical protein